MKNNHSGPVYNKKNNQVGNSPNRRTGSNTLNNAANAKQHKFGLGGSTLPGSNSANNNQAKQNMMMDP